MTHYEQMFEWALHLTGHDQARAEDLVHDVFVQLRLGGADFAAIENLEAYLFTVLRNLHRSQLTRAQRSPANPSLLVEYDSVAAGLQALHDDVGQRLETLSELRTICQFVCARYPGSERYWESHLELDLVARDPDDPLRLLVAEVKWRRLSAAERRQVLRQLESKWSHCALRTRHPNVRFEVLDASLLAS